MFLPRDPQKADIHDIPNIFAEDREKIHPKMAELCDGESYKQTKTNKNPESRQSFRRIICKLQKSRCLRQLHFFRQLYIRDRPELRFYRNRNDYDSTGTGTGTRSNSSTVYFSLGTSNNVCKRHLAPIT